MIKLNVSYFKKLTEVTEVILENLEKQQKEEKLKYLRDFLLDLDKEVIDAYWIDFGLDEFYIDAAKYQEEIDYLRNRPL